MQVYLRGAPGEAGEKQRAEEGFVLPGHHFHFWHGDDEVRIGRDQGARQRRKRPLVTQVPRNWELNVT